MARRMMGSIAVLVATGVGVLGASAGASVAAKPLPEKQWRNATNTICAENEQLLGEALDVAFAGLPPDGQPSAAQVQAYVEAAEPIIQERIDSIDALKEPTKLKAKVKKMLKTAQRELDALVADPSRVLEGNPFTDTTLAADKLDLEECGS